MTRFSPSLTQDLRRRRSCRYSTRRTPPLLLLILPLLPLLLLFPLLLLLPLLLLVLPVQRSARLHLRRRRQQSGTTNDQALQRFREAERLARLLKETPAEELIDLAQKAKYSQHEITSEELQHFDSYCRSCLRRLKEKPLYRQLIYRYFHAAY